MITRQIRVWGRVQGVGFRFFTQQLAIQLDITGTVQNKMDGSVLTVAQGEADTVYHFIERVKASTSPYGRVDRYEECTLLDAPLYAKFEII
ncbi:acylphosphatase [uncultured Granulicatella sp.]|uniref:acylphosphatase n=1 Tax=uncultured Granulicatella sp. TaxID=316089 RepID=UPI0026372390|nr:acylphosphatase [uncultured Granulicatella sp.]